MSGRPIKFRVWHKGRGRYTRNSAAHEDGAWEGSDLCLGPDGNLHYCDDGNGPRDLGRPSDCIVEQWTGLLDRSGREIYEGDVVRRPDGRIERVRWVSEEDGWDITGWLTEGSRHGDGLIEAEVVGNIHESPHLLNPSQQSQ